MAVRSRARPGRGCSQSPGLHLSPWRTHGLYQRERPRRDPRFRLEHCTVINDALVQRIKALGAIPTPFATYVYYHGEKMREYGVERLDHMFALRSFLDAGISVAPGSDYPPGPFEPMMALQSSVTRTDMNGNVWGPKHRITVEEALRVQTLHGAYASFEEREKGSIERGKLADLVVLGRDPFREDPSSLVGIPSNARWSEGAGYSKHEVRSGSQPLRRLLADS